MKRHKLNIIIFIVILFANYTVYAQTDSVNTFYPDEISIEYFKGSMQTITENKTMRAPVLTNLEGIKKIRFLNDSLISLSSEQGSEQQLNINKINGISIRSGNNTGIGIVLGALAGLLAGVAIGSTDNTSSSELGAIGTPVGGMIGAGSGVLIGGIIGGIIGSSSYTYKMYELNNNADKKKQIERILKIDNKRNRSEL